MSAPGGAPAYPDRRPLPDQPHWRQDFPTDVPEDDHVARREFVKFLVLTSGAFAAGQCWIALAGPGRAGAVPRTRVSTTAELEDRRAIEFRYPDEHEPCLALCLGPGRYVAYGQKCSHLACARRPTWTAGSCTARVTTDTSRPRAGAPSPARPAGPCRWST